MTILGIETSCDETSVAIIEGHDNGIVLKSNIVASSLSLHAATGGVIPENAAREQLKYMLPVLQEALSVAFDTSDTFDTFDTLKKIDAIAVTYGPGLIGSLLVGVETAKTLGYVLNKPIVPVNHMVGHIYANWLHDNPSQPPLVRGGVSSPPDKGELEGVKNAPEFPAIALVISGGHTDLLLLKNHGDLTLLGGTRDDAAGEAFDKIGRLLGLPYPAGPVIEKIAKDGDPKRFRFPRPLLGSNDYDFSFSGLKAAVLREVVKLRNSEQSLAPSPYTLSPNTTADIARSTQDAIIDVVVKKTLKAAIEHNAKSILISGGVAANQTLRDHFSPLTSQLSLNFFAPAKNLCTDNAAMIASAAFYNYKPVAWHEITANPELYFD